MDFETVADELYGLVPAGFTAARDARAAEARRDKDRDLAAALKALKRPSASAWLANVLVRRRPDEVDRLLSLAADLREAQDRLAGDQLRALSQQRHRVVAALVQEARRLGTEAGQAVSDGAARELQETLEAAMGDPAAAAALRNGRLTGALAYSGIGTPSGGADPPPSPATPSRPDAGAVGEAEAAWAGAEGRARDAAEALDEAEARHAELERSVAELSGRLEALRSEAEAAAARVEELRLAAGKAAAEEEAARIALEGLRDRS